MMKTLVFSDSHTDTDTMCYVTEYEKPDLIIHLGDHIADADKLAALYPDIDIIKIPGNTDIYHTADELIQYIEIGGKYVMMTHGNTFGVIEEKNGVGNLLSYGMKNSVNIILFGHTHRPCIEYSNGIWMMNPGRIGCVSRKKINSTYGIMQIEDGRIYLSLREVL